jgi:hypothetical protein
MLAVKDIGNGSLSLTGFDGMVAKLSLVECMSVVEDPRVDRTKAHDKKMFKSMLHSTDVSR